MQIFGNNNPPWGKLSCFCYSPPPNCSLVLMEQRRNETPQIPLDERRCFTKDATMEILPHGPHRTTQMGLSNPHPNHTGQCHFWKASSTQKNSTSQLIWFQLMAADPQFSSSDSVPLRPRHAAEGPAPALRRTAESSCSPRPVPPCKHSHELLGAAVPLWDSTAVLCRAAMGPREDWDCRTKHGSTWGSGSAVGRVRPTECPPAVRDILKCITALW